MLLDPRLDYKWLKTKRRNLLNIHALDTYRHIIDKRIHFNYCEHTNLMQSKQNRASLNNYGRKPHWLAEKSKQGLVELGESLKWQLFMLVKAHMKINQNQKWLRFPFSALNPSWRESERHFEEETDRVKLISPTRNERHETIYR